MKRLIVCATKTEILCFLQHFNYVEQSGLWQSEDKNNIDVFICGIGNIYAAVNLSIVLEKHIYSHIIISGIAGAYNNDIELCSCFIVENESMPEMCLVDNDSFQSHYNNKLLPEKYKSLKFDTIDIFNNLKLKKGNSATVNTLNHNKEFVSFIINNYKAEIENMESYGLALVAQKKRIPISQIRAISNYVSEKNRANWKIKEAIAVLNNLLIEII